MHENNNCCTKPQIQIHGLSAIDVNAVRRKLDNAKWEPTSRYDLAGGPIQALFKAQFKVDGIALIAFGNPKEAVTVMSMQQAEGLAISCVHEQNYEITSPGGEIVMNPALQTHEQTTDSFATMKRRHQQQQRKIAA